MAAGDPPRRRTRRMLLSFLWPLGIGDRETAQAEPVTTAAVRASQHRQNCATSVACRLLRISTREAVRIVRAHASPLLPLCLLVDAISDVFLAAMRTLPLPGAVAFNTRRARLRRRPRTSAVVLGGRIRPARGCAPASRSNAYLLTPPAARNPSPEQDYCHIATEPSIQRSGMVIRRSPANPATSACRKPGTEGRGS
jgi:hypothetical protein